MAVSSIIRSIVRSPVRSAIVGQAGGGARIVLSSSSIAEDASVGDAVGTLSVVGGSGSYTFTEVADPGSAFAIDGDVIEVDAALSAGSYSYTVQADNGVDAPIQKVFTITATTVAAVGESIGLLFLLTKAA